MWDYAKSVGGEMKNFLSTLGLDLQRIIPPQVTAAFGVLGAALSPLKKLGMGLFGGKDKDTKKMTKQLGFKGFGRDTLKAALQDVEDAVKPQKQGIWDKITGFFKNFSLKGLGKGLMGLLSGRGLFSGLKALLRFLPQIGRLFSRFAGPLAEVVAAVAVFGSAIWGAVKGIADTKAEWVAFFKSIVNFGSAAGELLAVKFSQIGDWISDKLPWLKDMFDGIKSLADFLISLPVKLLKMIAEGWQNIFGWLGVGDIS